MDRIDPPEGRNREESREESAPDSPASSSSSASRGSTGPTPPSAASSPRPDTNGSGISSNGVSHTHSTAESHARGRSNGAEVSATIGTARPGPVCRVCPLRSSCRSICEVIEAILPSPERGRVDAEDLPRLFSGMRMVRALLDFAHTLTDRQQEVVRLYYRESLQQKEIADRLGISQQAVHDSLRRARKTIGEKIVQGGGDALSVNLTDATQSPPSGNSGGRRLDS